jgi:hypothetical protein
MLTVQPIHQQWVDDEAVVTQQPDVAHEQQQPSESF